MTRKKQARLDGFSPYQKQQRRKEQTLDNRRFSQYGISTSEYQQRFIHQGGLCAIYGRRTVQLLAVDHDHTTGQVRGLLCSACNLGLGCFNDSPSLLLEAAAYLELGQEEN